jgi:hypothetical protein
VQLPAVVAAQTAGTTKAAAPLPRAALLHTTTARTGAEAERDAAVDAVVHDATDRLGVVEITARPALDLQSIQLSLDCVGETPACLLAVAKKLQVDVLIAPALQRSDETLVLDILYFDARGAELRRVTRRQPGRELEAQTLDQVEPMLRELLDIVEKPAVAPEAAAPPPKVVAPAPQAPSAADFESASTFAEPGESEGDGVPVGAVLLAGGGALALGGGIAAGLMMMNTEDEYQALDVTSATEADAAHDKLEEGRTQALVASVLLGTGGAALAASAIWLAIDLTDDDAPTEAALHPMLGRGHAGLMLSGSWRGGP